MRYELKYHPKSLGYRDILQIIHQHPAGFTSLYPDRIINNVYFDSPDLQSFYESVNGVPTRKKYRLRWYGEGWSFAENPVIETKIKLNHLGDKVLRPWHSFPLPNIAEETEAMKRESLLPKGFVRMSTNRYKRSYFGTAEGLFRITIDRTLSFGSFLTGFSIPDTPENQLVVELKYDEKHHEDAEWIRQYIPFQRIRFSKYAQGVIETLL